jgi:phosphatidate cytidylyltransferase
MNRVLIRVIGAPLILLILGLILYFDHRRSSTHGITVVVAIFAGVSFWELAVMARLKGLKPSVVIGLAGILLPYAFRIFGHTTWVTTVPFSTAVAVLFTLALLIWMVLRSSTFTPLDAAFTALAFVYLSLLLFVFGFYGTPKEWLLWLLFLVATNKGSDMAAYVVGKRFGRHPMAPVISPKKTWEGAVAGFVVGTTAGAFVLHQIAGRGGVEGVVRVVAIAACVTVAAQLGDLVKSVIKRWAGVKDSGRLLPEFGGALDMVDSFILSAPVAVLAMDFLI